MRGIAILADEVYGTLIYDGAAHAPSFLSIADNEDAIFAINSFSKPWAMTGWRIGWLVHPKELEPAAAAMAQCNNTGSTHFAQYGALAALSPEGDVFRGELLARCRRPRCGRSVDRPPEPGALAPARRRLLRLPACGRAVGQSALLPGHGAQ